MHALMNIITFYYNEWAQLKIISEIYKTYTQ